MAATPLRIMHEQSVIRRPMSNIGLGYVFSLGQINTSSHHSYPSDPWVEGRKCTPAYQRTKETRKTIIPWHFSNKNDLSTEVNNVDSIYVYRYFDNGWQKKTEIRIVSHRRSVVAQSDVCCLVNNPAPERNASFRSCNKRVDSFNNFSFQFGQLWQKHQQTNSPAKWDDQRFHSHVGRLKQISPIGPSSVA